MEGKGKEDDFLKVPASTELVLIVLVCCLIVFFVEVFITNAMSAHHRASSHPRAQ